MSQKDNIVTLKLKKAGSKLVPATPYNESQYKEFVNALEEDQVVDIFFEANKDDGTNAQLAKIHACIRKLALETGYTFEAMKTTIKERSGLSYGNLNSSEGFTKSFADCSTEELALVIEALNEAGEMVNLRF
jgi:N-acyl-D-aspartate/D-glutamate deacylase